MLFRSRIQIPLTVRPDGLVIDVHRRLAIAMELGFTEVPTVCLDDEQLRAMFLTYTSIERAHLMMKAPELRPIYLKFAAQARGSSAGKHRRRRR